MKKRILSDVSLAALLAALAVACVQTPTTNQTANTNAAATNTSAAALPPELKPALDTIKGDDILQHTTVLSSDEYEGRGPGTRGEELTVKYLTEQYQRL